MARRRGYERVDADPYVNQLRQHFGGDSIEVNEEHVNWCAEQGWCPEGGARALARNKAEFERHYKAQQRYELRARKADPYMPLGDIWRRSWLPMYRRHLRYLAESKRLRAAA